MLNSVHNCPLCGAIVTSAYTSRRATPKAGYALVCWAGQWWHTYDDKARDALIILLGAARPSRPTTQQRTPARQLELIPTP